jgi:hypothetical protein
MIYRMLAKSKINTNQRPPSGLVFRRIALFLRKAGDPLGSTEYDGGEGTDRAEALGLAADETVVVEGLEFLRLAGPKGAESEVASEAGTEQFAAVAPAAVAEHRLTHLIIIQKELIQ